MTSTWQNRIVGYGTETPNQLVANPKNWRVHPKHQQVALKGALDDLGWIQNVIVNQRTGFVVDGHARVALALRHDQAEVPVTYVDLSESEEALALATLDPISAMAGADKGRLEALLAEVGTGEVALQTLLSGLAANNGVVPGRANDPDEHWLGMPEYENHDLSPVKQIVVSFAAIADVEAFARLVKQNVTMMTKSVWYPSRERKRQVDYAYVEDGDAA